MKTKCQIILVIAVFLTATCPRYCYASEAVRTQGASVALEPYSAEYDIDDALRGAVRFRALIRNRGATPITIAHPSICFPRDYSMGETKHFSEHYGRSEILLTVVRPDGEKVVLRWGFLGGFDPGNFLILEVPPGGTGTFDLGWFFNNARGAWERDDVAAILFTKRGRYKVTLLFRNFFPRALLFDPEKRESSFIDAWTGEMESGQVTVDIK